MYVDRHSIELLLKYSAPDATLDENELRHWLTVLVDRANTDAREEFTTTVANGDYPLNAVRAQTVPEGEVSLSVDQAPPALILILGEAVDPDTLDARNNVPKDLEEPLKVALATWNRDAIGQMLNEEGWKTPVDGPSNTEPDDSQPVDEPNLDEDEVVDQGDDSPSVDPDIIDDQDVPDEDPVEVEESSRKKLLMAVGAVVAVGVGFWMWRRRSSGS